MKSAVNEIASVIEELHSYKKAMKYFNKAIELDPGRNVDLYGEGIIVSGKESRDYLAFVETVYLKASATV